MATFKVQTLIQTSEDLNFLVESNGGYESSYDVTMGQEANSNPSPVGRSSTSSTRTNNDVININGWIRCLRCNGTIVDTTDYLSRVKRTIEAQKYTAAEFATLTNNDGVFLNMQLMNVNWRRNGDFPQEILVSMTWQSANFTGSVDSPMFSIGGLAR